MITTPITTPITMPLVHGGAELEQTARGVRPHRLPAWVRDRFPDPQLLAAESRPAGVRLTMTTGARELVLALHATRMGYRGAHRPRGAVDLVLDGELVASAELDGGDLIELDPVAGATEFHPAATRSVTFADLPGGLKRVELWLPHNESVELVELRTDEPVEPTGPRGRRWVHHGSSISQGSNASSPARTWAAIAARRGGVELHNLGFGGSAMVDPFVARVIRDAPADLISLKFGINVVNLDAMRLRTFVPAVHGFLDTIRDGHPDTPILLLSPIFCAIHEDTPGPGAIDTDAIAAGEVRFTATGDPGDTRLGRLTLRVVREALESVAANRADDENLRYLSGIELYGEADHALPDGLHPDTEAHRLIGERFARHVFGL
ncbi:GDSL-like lipase/acylhydrolase family protein [Labedaea rhizosphaerae]|uniref:GDSL-like lipase/acylhydrolase family protein n=2 Tax=Labedaea rhizosphaerae TaxID=598644 RepID=A0A4R6SH37_LABRH|nr:SGNH/GDSL hydrolase family protein [Labedaea rhizosphaerae]TDQ00238.1 GDSL-like lipase/acylhydrolase family protein [Labedaea rhizosphaerae]